MNPDLLARLEGIADLDDAALQVLLDDLRAEGERLAAEEPRTADVVADLNSVADAVESVVASQETRAADAERLETEAQAAIARLAPPAADADETPDEDAAPAEESGPQAVAAAATRPALGTVRTTTSAAPTPAADTTPRSTIVAAAEVPGLTAGQELRDRRALGEAFAGRLRALGRGGSGEQVVVASVQYNYPEERRLADSPEQNTQRIEAVTDRSAIVAAGLCAPLDNLYDVEILGVTDRPVRDSLAQFQATRGGIQFRVPPAFTALSGAVDQWTNALDTTPGGETKNIVDVVCASLDTANVYAVTTRLRFSNVTARFDPEMTAANIDAAMVATARNAENLLLAGINAKSKVLTVAKTMGASRDILVAIDHVIAYYRSRHRLSSRVPLRWVGPQWVNDLFRADLTRALHTSNLDALAVADTQIGDWFARRNVNATFHLDGTAAESAITGPPAIPAIPRQDYADTTTGDAMPGFPDKLSFNLFAEGDFLFLDGGTLDLGVVRDSTTNATNRYEMFTESFEAVAFRGLEALRVVATVQPTGGSAATVDASALAD